MSGGNVEQWLARWTTVPGWLRWMAGLLLAAIVLALVVPPFLEAWARERIESGMNARLEGYSARLPEVDIHFAGLAITLHDLIITQDAHPDPPVAKVPAVRASVEWRQLLRGRLLADFALDRPVFYLNIRQLRKEIEDPVPADERGWRRALESAYFLDLNRIRVRDGALTYIDVDPERPLHARAIQFRAEDIRAARNEGGPFPSPFAFEAMVFD